MNTCLKRFSERRGVTLLEVISAVAVIVILFAIVFSVYPGVRNASERSACASNLRQIGHLTQLFSADNDGKILLAEMRPEKDAKFDQANYWPQKLSKYIGEPFRHVKGADGKYDYSRNTLRELMCPTLARVKLPGSWNPSYAMFGSPADPNMSDGASYIYVGMIPNPSGKVYIGDSPWESGGSAESFWKGLANRPVSNSDLDVKDPRGIVFRHDLRANLLFHDGHVESLMQSELPLPPRHTTTSHEFLSMFNWTY